MDETGSERGNDDKTRRFIVGIDAEGHSDEAIHAALRLCQRFGAKLSLLHAVQVPPAMWIASHAGKSEAMRAEIVAPARTKMLAQLTSLAQKLELAPGALTDALRVAAGETTKVLLDHTTQSKRDLLFLGEHMQHSLLDLGTTTGHVLPLTPCGLWVQHGAALEIEQVLIPIDLEEWSNEMLPQALAFAHELQAQVCVLHAVKLDAQRAAAHARTEEVLANALEQAGQDQNAATVTVVVDDAVEAILGRECAGQLTVMATRGHGGVPGLVLGSTTHAVLKRSGRPVLALRALA